MIRVMYRWTIKPGHEAEFIRNWDAGTRRIRQECEGSYGSMMLRSAKNREHFYGIGRWESRAAWDAAQPAHHRDEADRAAARDGAFFRRDGRADAGLETGQIVELSGGG